MEYHLLPCLFVDHLGVEGAKLRFAGMWTACPPARFLGSTSGLRCSVSSVDIGNCLWSGQMAAKNGERFVVAELYWSVFLLPTHPDRHLLSELVRPSRRFPARCMTRLEIITYSMQSIFRATRHAFLLTRGPVGPLWYPRVYYLGHLNPRHLESQNVDGGSIDTTIRGLAVFTRVVPRWQPEAAETRR
jgi:hypothetical protein